MSCVASMSMVRECALFSAHSRLMNSQRPNGAVGVPSVLLLAIGQRLLGALVAVACICSLLDRVDRQNNPQGGGPEEQKALAEAQKQVEALNAALAALTEQLAHQRDAEAQAKGAQR